MFSPARKSAAQAGQGNVLKLAEISYRQELPMAHLPRSAGTWQAKLFRRVACHAPLLRRHRTHSARAGAALLRPLVRHASRAVGCVSAGRDEHRAARASHDVRAFGSSESQPMLEWRAGQFGDCVAHVVISIIVCSASSFSALRWQTSIFVWSGESACMRPAYRQQST